jgi:hypothetical protein
MFWLSIFVSKSWETGLSRRPTPIDKICFYNDLELVAEKYIHS